MQARGVVLPEHLVCIPLDLIVCILACLAGLATRLGEVFGRVRVWQVRHRCCALVERILSEHVDFLGQADECTDLRKLDNHLAVQVFLSLDLPGVALQMSGRIEIDMLADLSKESLLNSHKL